jgi:threonine aldolase
MGILSMVFFCFVPLAVGLGIGAIVMANNDLAKMRSGAMDRSGQGATQAGLVCGVIGVIIGAIIVFLSCTNAMNH